MNRRYFGLVPLFASFLALLLIAGCGSESSTDPGGGDPPAGPRIWYVDDDAMGSGSGSSWGNAIAHPSVAMDSSSAGDQIWVAFGTYYGLGNRSAPVVAFKAGVSLYGDFEGTETNLSERNSYYRATFDGGDTLYHVVTGADDALLHGIYVEHGRATNLSSPSEMRGAGIYCLNAKMRIALCYISDNEAYLGGGIYAEGDTVIIDSCTVRDNRSPVVSVDESAGGGGINIHAGRAVITGTVIRDNTSSAYGGGLLLYNSSAVVSGGLVALNSTADPGRDGGGVYIYNADAVELETEFVGCTISQNEAPRGAGIAANQSKIGFNDCTFMNNEAATSGSALHMTHCSYLMEHCILSSNGASALLTAYYMGPTPPRVFNCIFVYNGNNERQGGAIYHIGPLEIDFCTITGNIAEEGAGIYSIFPTSTTVVTNSIIWGNGSVSGPDQIQSVDGATASVTLTDIDQDGFADPGLWNLRSDPLFVVVGLGGAGRYYLSHIGAGQAADSPCIDKGSGTPIMHGLHERTTRTDSAFDTMMPDLGFHYKPMN